MAHTNAVQEMPVTKQQQGFGVVTSERSAELAAIAVAAAAKAEVESAYIMALKQPRHEDEARAKIVRTCLNPTFAGKAKFRKPVGKVKDERTGQWNQNYAVGPSIRFAEEALRHWGNVLVQQTALYDDEHKRIVKVAVKDLQSNLTYSQEITLDKQVERRDGRGRQVLGERKNTDGYVVYILKATEDELAVKQAAQVSKAIRNSGLRLVPDYIVEEAMEQINATITSKVKQDPDAERRKLVDAFFALGIKASELEAYLGHPLAQCSTDDLIELTEMCNSIRDGHASWGEFMQAAKEDDGKAMEQDSAKLADAKAKMAAAAPAQPAAPPLTATPKAPSPARQARAAAPQAAPAHVDVQPPSEPVQTSMDEPDMPQQPAPNEIDDVRWREIIKHLESNRELTSIAKRVKDDMSILNIGLLKGPDRRAFTLTVQDAVRRVNEKRSPNVKLDMPTFVEDVR